MARSGRRDLTCSARPPEMAAPPGRASWSGVWQTPQRTLRNEREFLLGSRLSRAEAQDADWQC